MEPEEKEDSDLVLAKWEDQIKAIYRSGNLPGYRSKVMESLPGWEWTKSSVNELKQKRRKKLLEDREKERAEKQARRQASRMTFEEKQKKLLEIKNQKKIEKERLEEELRKKCWTPIPLEIVVDSVKAFLDANPKEYALTGRGKPWGHLEEPNIDPDIYGPVSWSHLDDCIKNNMRGLGVPKKYQYNEFKGEKLFYASLNDLCHTVKHKGVENTLKLIYEWEDDIQNQIDKEKAEATANFQESQKLKKTLMNNSKKLDKKSLLILTNKMLESCIYFDFQLHELLDLSVKLQKA